MKNKVTFRSKVFKRAYEIMRNTGKAFAVCLSKAWAIYRLTKKLLNSDEVVLRLRKKTVHFVELMEH